MPAQSCHDARLRRRQLLTTIGQLLRTEYSAVERPVSEHLATLLKKIETCESEHASAPRVPDGLRSLAAQYFDEAAKAGPKPVMQQQQQIQPKKDQS
jgi:hypothetical protein